MTAVLEYQISCPSEWCEGIIPSSVILPGAIIHCPECRLEMKVADTFKGPLPL